MTAASLLLPSSGLNAGAVGIAARREAPRGGGEAFVLPPEERQLPSSRPALARSPNASAQQAPDRQDDQASPKPDSTAHGGRDHGAGAEAKDAGSASSVTAEAEQASQEAAPLGEAVSNSGSAQSLETQNAAVADVVPAGFDPQAVVPQALANAVDAGLTPGSEGVEANATPDAAAGSALVGYATAAAMLAVVSATEAESEAGSAASQSLASGQVQGTTQGTTQVASTGQLPVTGAGVLPGSEPDAPAGGGVVADSAKRDAGSAPSSDAKAVAMADKLVGDGSAEPATSMPVPEKPAEKAADQAASTLAKAELAGKPEQGFGQPAAKPVEPQLTMPLSAPGDPAQPLPKAIPPSAVPIEIGLRSLQGLKEFQIRLDPAELGRVDVKLEIGEDKTVTARVVVDRVETLHLLQREARTLERAFEQAGLKSSDAGVDITLRDPGSQGNNGRRDTEGGDGERGPASDRSAKTAAIEAQTLPIRRTLHVGALDRSI